MLKAVKNVHCNKKQKTLQQQKNTATKPSVCL